MDNSKAAGPNADVLISTYVRIRDHIDRRRKEVEQELTEYKEQLAVVEKALDDMLKEAGPGASIKTDHGVAYHQTSDRVALESWDSFLEFVRREEAWHMLQKAVTKTAVKEYMAENEGALPPGVQYSTEVKVRVRRGRAAGKKEDQNG